MSECPNLVKCPIFNKFRSEGMANMWIRSYCKDNFDNCKRKKLKDQNKEMPITLLPNGSHLQSLAD